jgi:hypothetical protein
VAERIGDFLVRIGAMTATQAQAVLDAQAGDPEGDIRMFGEIAVELGFVDDAALKKYIEQKSAGL